MTWKRKTGRGAEVWVCTRHSWLVLTASYEPKSDMWEAAASVGGRSNGSALLVDAKQWTDGGLEAAQALAERLADRLKEWRGSWHEESAPRRELVGIDG